jgi:hypothetical protein
MKIQSLVVAASLVLVPATTALAGDAKKEAAAKAKEAAKEKAIEAAKAKSAAKLEHVKEVAATKAAPAAAAAAAGGDAAAQQAEKETHARNLGAIERLQQIADATSNGDLKTVLQRLSDKETKRHNMATGS